jgi:hypothetical protein
MDPGGMQRTLGRCLHEHLSVFCKKGFDQGEKTENRNVIFFS